MRSSKSRSRSKSNRNNRSVGNVVNRVFDSSGPEGKVRGTPQQIIDKYNQLARDAQLSNDRVATENFQQHAEHYLRMLADAMKEQAERQAQQQQQQDRQQQDRQQRSQNNNNNNGGGQNNNANTNNEQPRAEQPPRKPQPQEAGAPEAQQAKPKAADVIDVAESGEASPLVETPENTAQKPRRTRRKAEEAPKAEAPKADEQAAPPSAAPDAAE